MTPVYRSLKTKETYERALSQLRLALKAPDNDFFFLKDSAPVIQWIESLDRAVNTRKVYYIAIVSYLKGAPEFADVYPDYKAKMDSYNAAVSAQMEAQQLSPAEQEKFLEWPEIIKARERIREAAYDLMTYQDYVLVCLYTLIPPARADYAPMRVLTEDSDQSGNYLLVLPAGLTFVMNEYKTAHKYGQQRVAVPPDLEAILRDWLELNPSGWLLCNSDGKPLSEAGLCQHIISVFKTHTGKAVGINILRHSYVSWVRRNETPFLEQKKLAAGMYHSVGMSQLYRRL